MSTSTDLRSYCLNVATRARTASRKLATVSSELKNRWLTNSAAALRNSVSELASANQIDLAAAPAFGLTAAQTDRLRLDQDRIEGIATALEQLASLPDPIGEILDKKTRPSGIEIQKIRVPLGVVFFIYESRPNVTADAAGLCVKSGNAVILRGGKEAANSSRVIIDVMREVGEQVGLPSDAVQLVSESDRETVRHFLKLNELIDLAIPRGGEGLIRTVATQATMPVIKHFAGNCHVYVDQAADLEMAEQIVVNSKCQRMGVCNAAESLLIHERVASDFLPRIAAAFASQQVELRVDKIAQTILPDARALVEDDLSQEYLGPVMSVCIVRDHQAAIEHINRYGSGHTDAIVTGDQPTAAEFLAGVDSAAVMVNTSTRFNDGNEFGLGAEIGISTDKFHARGPCGLNELTTYKYLVLGNGQIRT